MSDSKKFPFLSQLKGTHKELLDLLCQGKTRVEVAKIMGIEIYEVVIIFNKAWSEYDKQIHQQHTF